MTNHNYRFFLFDLGGTLLYFRGDWEKTLKKGIQQLTQTLLADGFDLPEEVFQQEFYKRLQEYYQERETDRLELTSSHLLRNLLAEYGYPKPAVDLINRALASLYQTTQGHWLIEAETMPLLTELKSRGYRLGLITNASDASDARTLLGNHQLNPFFELVFISAEVGFRKPHPRMFLMAMELWNAQPQEVVMVGDTLGADVLGAQNAGITSLWVKRRAHNRENQRLIKTIKPDYSIESLADLLPLIDEWHASGAKLE